jgi:predicted Fe-S protein YdhL (DUF1289 family)
VKSPCIRRCCLINNICTGCGRTIEEIRNWKSLSEEERNKIMERLCRKKS